MNQSSLQRAFNPLFLVRASLACVSALALSESVGFGQTTTWNGSGTDSNWSTGANWVGSVAPVSGTASALEFAGTTGLTPFTDTNWTVQKITINAGSGNFQFSGSTITVFGSVSSGDSTPAVRNNATGQVTFNNNFVTGAGASTGAQFLNAGGGMILNGNISMARNTGFGNFNTGLSKALVINGVVSGAANVNFNAGGLVIVNGTNSYTGITNIYNATVLLGGNVYTGTASALGNASSSIFMGATGALSPTLLTNGAFTVDRAIQIGTPSSGVMSGTIGGATANISTFSRDITMGNVGAAAQSLVITATTGGRVNITGNLTRASGATGSLDSMTKVGNGIVALAGSNNTYSGTTLVNAGTLLVNGTVASGTAAVSVASAAILGGSGAINRLVSVGANATLSPGDMNGSGLSQSGTLSLGAGLSLVGTSILAFNLDSPSSANDRVDITGALTLDGVLNVTSPGNLSYGNYKLLTYTGALTDNTLTIGSISLAGGYSASIDTSTAGEVRLSVVPEPSTVGMFFAGAGIFLVVMKRRTARVS